MFQKKTGEYWQTGKRFRGLKEIYEGDGERRITAAENENRHYGQSSLWHRCDLVFHGSLTSEPLPLACGYTSVNEIAHMSLVWKGGDRIALSFCGGRGNVKESQTMGRKLSAIGTAVRQKIGRNCCVSPGKARSRYALLPDWRCFPKKEGDFLFKLPLVPENYIRPYDSLPPVIRGL